MTSPTCLDTRLELKCNLFYTPDRVVIGNLSKTAIIFLALPPRQVLMFRNNKSNIQITLG